MTWFSWLVQQEKTQSRLLFRFAESVNPHFFFKNINDSGQDSRLNLNLVREAERRHLSALNQSGQERERDE
jgi:hypothetical protein